LKGTIVNREPTEAERNSARRRIAEIAGRLLAEAWLREKRIGESNCSGESAPSKIHGIDPPDEGLHHDDLHQLRD